MKAWLKTMHSPMQQWYLAKLFLAHLVDCRGLGHTYRSHPLPLLHPSKIAKSCIHPFPLTGRQPRSVQAKQLRCCRSVSRPAPLHKAAPISYLPAATLIYRPPAAYLCRDSAADLPPSATWFHRILQALRKTSVTRRPLTVSEPSNHRMHIMHGLNIAVIGVNAQLRLQPWNCKVNISPTPQPTEQRIKSFTSWS